MEEKNLLFEIRREKIKDLSDIELKKEIDKAMDKIHQIVVSYKEEENGLDEVLDLLFDIGVYANELNYEYGKRNCEKKFSKLLDGEKK